MAAIAHPLYTPNILETMSTPLPLTRTTPVTSPVKILQFGEGNFMRGFVDWMINHLNAQTGFNGAVEIVTPRAHAETADVINAQGGLYTVVLRGQTDGHLVDSAELITCVKGCLNPATQWEEVLKTACLPELRFVFSNTTEAGIEYKPGVDTFPSKLARLVTARYQAGRKGLVFIPCELIENNGNTLRDCILRYLDNPKVIDYVNRECRFCNTLVDRIVSGFPRDDVPRYRDKLGYDDRLIVCAEPFYFFALEGAEDLRDELPFREAGLDVVFTRDLRPYRTRKVRFLNGAHTASVLAAHLAGHTFVDEMVRDPRFNTYLRAILFDEIFPTVNLPDAEKRAFAESVLERFANPFAQHRLLSIALNSVSKWKVRILPTILDYLKIFGKLPPNLTQSMASLINFYRTPDINDTPEVMAFFATKPSVRDILAAELLWGQDLNMIPGFTQTIENGVSR